MKQEVIKRRNNAERKYTGVQVGGVLSIVACMPILVTRAVGPAAGAVLTIIAFLLLYLSGLKRAFAARKVTRILYPPLMISSYLLACFFHIKYEAQNGIELPIILLLCLTTLLLWLEYIWTTGYMENDREAKVDNHPLYLAIKSIFRGK
tara:strand:- start:3613 stop:4059 length:447 start_codon:yes stop_codon:yes gene_type:complete